MSGTVSRLGNIFEDVAAKAAVRLATTGGNIVLSGLPVMDGVQTVDGDRVLVRDQTDLKLNGIWQVTTGVWSRTRDASSNTDLIDGTLVLVAHGIANAGKLFVCSCADSPIVIGTSSITFPSQSDVIANQQSAVSSTSHTISIGGKSFGISPNKDIDAGQYVLIYETSAPDNAMLGKVGVNDGGVLVANVIAVAGSGTHSDWTIVLTSSPASVGRIPPVGTGNVNGPGAAVSGHIAVFSDTTGNVIADAGIAPGVLAGRTRVQASDFEDYSVPAWALAPNFVPLCYNAPQPNDNLHIVNDVANPTRDFNVTAGRCRSDADVVNLSLAATMAKRLDAAWAVGGVIGGPAGACDTGVKGANETWHIFLIAKHAAGVITGYSRTANITSISMGAHGLAVGGTVVVYGLPNTFNATAQIIGATTNTFSYVNNGPDSAPAVPTFALADAIDIIASKSYATPAFPPAWFIKACIGSVMTDGAGNIRQFTQVGDVFHWATPVTDVNAIASTAARVATPLTVPNGVAVFARFRAGINIGAGSPGAIIFTALAEADVAAAQGANADLSNVTNTFANGSFDRLTNTSAQIGVRSLNNNTTVTIVTTSYRDPRRRLF